MSTETHFTESGQSPGRQQTVNVTCARCGEQRWIPVPYIPLDDRGRQAGPPRDLRDPDGSYLCQRCRAVLAGGNVADPAAHLTPTEAQRAARATAAERLRKPRQSPPAGRGLGTEAPRTIPEAADTLAAEERRAERLCQCQRGICTVCNPAQPTVKGELPADWKARRAQVKNRDGNRCKHCGSRERLSVHHIVPRPVGTHDPRNLVTLCDPCHDVAEQAALVIPGGVA
jgi:DNA-directed RNA polymerase subunit RPC12/RpoP